MCYSPLPPTDKNKSKSTGKQLLQQSTTGTITEITPPVVLCANFFVCACAKAMIPIMLKLRGPTALDSYHYCKH